MAQDASSDVHYGPARPEEVEAIHALLAESARAGLVLPRPMTDIRHNLANFIVARNDRELLGCVAMRDYGQGLFEVRSLVVDRKFRSLGIGSRLVRRCVRAAEERRAHSIFALTYHPDLFRRLDFKVVPKEMFPRKVWADCRHCAKQDCCDETALVHIFE